VERSGLQNISLKNSDSFIIAVSASIATITELWQRGVTSRKNGARTIRPQFDGSMFTVHVSTILSRAGTLIRPRSHEAQLFPRTEDSRTIAAECRFAFCRDFRVRDPHGSSPRNSRMITGPLVRGRANQCCSLARPASFDGRAVLVFAPLLPCLKRIADLLLSAVVSESFTVFAS
jgi:hypothetical protein